MRLAKVRILLSAAYQGPMILEVLRLELLMTMLQKVLLLRSVQVNG